LHCGVVHYTQLKFKQCTAKDNDSQKKKKGDSDFRKVDCSNNLGMSSLAFCTVTSGSL
jgi:hypothetical protein